MGERRKDRCRHLKVIKNDTQKVQGVFWDGGQGTGNNQVLFVTSTYWVTSQKDSKFGLNTVNQQV